MACHFLEPDHSPEPLPASKVRKYDETYSGTSMAFAVFNNMSRAQWQTPIRSKVNSSLNLHSVLPAELAFFVLLSSSAGLLGNLGQTNYATGCTLKDALCRLESARGEIHCRWIWVL